MTTGIRQLAQVLTEPWRTPLSEAERARRRERIARVRKKAGNSPQPEKPWGPEVASPSAPISAP